VKTDGSVQEFRLRLIVARPGLRIGRYDISPPRLSTFLPRFEVPQDSWSDGYFWSRRAYVVYRFRDPTGEPLGHRFDAVSGVEFSTGGVTFRDLILDWWALADGRLVEEDGEEFEELVSTGDLKPADIDRALSARRTIRRDYRRIIAEISTLEDEFKIPAGRAAPGSG